MISAARLSFTLLRKLTSLGLVLTTSPALAERWPGAESSPYGAITARTIGMMCAGSLKAEEIYDLDLYLARKRFAGMTADAAAARDEWNGYATLEQGVARNYRDAARCSGEAAELARDMVGRIRRDAPALCADGGCFDP